MALFSKRDRIAIAVISALILTGWGMRFITSRQIESAGVTVIRHAAENIPAIENADSLNALLTKLYSPVNLNTADVEKIMTLPMIGPVKAAAIIEYRNDHGAFSGTRDILNVTGIGPATYEKIKDSITVTAEIE
jgi:comEA protein